MSELQAARKLWISDIHGHYDSMIEVLKASNYLPGYDTLIVGGDMIDRGPDSIKTIAYIKALQEAHPGHVEVIMGNHEELMLGSLITRNDSYIDCWLSNGGMETLNDIREHQDAGRGTYIDEIMDWVSKLPLLLSDEEFIYVHAGIHPGLPLNEQVQDDLLWHRYVEIDSETARRCKILIEGRTIVHGHTPNLQGIFNYDGYRIACDRGSYSSRGALAVVDLTHHIYYEYVNKQKEIVTRSIEYLTLEGGHSHASTTS